MNVFRFQILLLLIVFTIFSNICFGDKNSKSEQEDLIKLINDGRKKNGLKPLKPNHNIDKLAQNWAEHMQKTNMLLHNDFKGGQCIAEGKNAETVYKAWMGSKPHREGLMGKEYKDVGIGKSGKYWVVNLR